jgi:hypothetical protein
MSLVEIKLTVRQFFDDVYNQRNLDSIDSILTPGFVYHASRNCKTGKEGRRIPTSI